MKVRIVVVIAGAVLTLLPVVAAAQAPCSIQTITGTYAVQVTGQSLLGSLVPTGAPYQVAGGEAVFVARLTIAPDGSVEGPMWGVYVAQAVEIPFSAHVTVNADCTGDLVSPDETFKLVILDQGREIRWIPWDGFGGSSATWHRITRAGDPAPSCGQHALNGNYAMRCEGFELTGVGSGVASSWSLFLLSATDGEMSGRMYGKRFGLPISTLTESNVSGTYTVNGDCTVEQEFLFDILPGLAYKARGVVYDQGKQAVGLPLGVYAGDTFIAPVLPRTCVMTRMGQ